MRKSETPTPNRLTSPRPLQDEAEAGPRPLSAVQRAYQEAQGNTLATPKRIPLVPVQRRDASTTRVRVRVRNRRRRDWPRLLLGIAAVTLVGECIAALLFSPRLNIRTVTVEGNQAVSTARILALIGKVKGKNIVRLSASHLTASLLKEPTIESVEVRRALPDKVRLVIHERSPWAVVTTPGGTNYTIDEKRVPFRQTAEPEAGLPRLALSLGESQPTVTLGKPMTAPGLSVVSACLDWAGARPDFPLTTVAIDPTGKLCLNRIGNMQVRLGSETDLPKKLKALGLLLELRPDLKTTTNIAYVNLYAYDAPAVMPRPAIPPPSTVLSASRTTPPLEGKPEQP